MNHLRAFFQLHKFWMALCCCLLLLPAAAAATGMRPNPIRVGYTDSPGFIEKTADGTIDGYGVAYLNEISHYTGWRYEYVASNWQGCLDLLAKGEIDLLGMAQYTPERAEKYDFASLPCGVEYMVMYVRNDDNGIYYNDYQSFNGLKIGVLQGNFQTEVLSEVARKNSFTYQPVLFASSQSMIAALQNKQIDAVVTGSMPLYKDLRLVARFQADPIYFITTKGNKAILQRLNDALMNIHANTPEFENTTYTTYYEQSSLLTQPLLTKKERDYLAHRGPITIGFLPNDEPLSSLSSTTQQPAGILPSIIKELERLAGVQVIFKLLPAGARLDQSLQAEGFDLIAGVTDYEPYRNNISIRLSKTFFQGRVMAVAHKNSFIDITKPQKVALPFNYVAYKNLILSNYPHFSIINKTNTKECLQAVADGEADLALQNSHIISYHLQNPRFSELQILSLFNFPDNLSLAAVNNADGNQLLAIFNKCIDTLNPKTLDNIVMYETVQSPYQPSLTDLLYKYDYLIAALVIVLIVLFTAWLYFTQQQQKYLELLEAKNLELEGAAQQALAASEAKSSFLSRMSHEIRTPLNAILGFTRLALQPDKQSSRNEYLQKISYSSELLLGIVNDVLDMSAIENQKLKLDNSPFQLSKVLHELQSIYSAQCQAKNISFRLHRDDAGHDFLLGDSLRLQQILSNLLSNAVKFTEAGGQITLSITQQQAGAAGKTVLDMTVTDTGCGMSEQMLAQVFQPFEQEDGSTARKYGGSGLGLSIVKHLVELMDGSISVQSSKGSGSTFTVRLTLPYAENITAAGSDTGAAQNLPGLKLLLAEDNLLNQELCLELLQSRGISSDCANNGQEALELFNGSVPGTYDLILMDIQMPVMDGYQATQAIRASSHPQAQTIPIISLSADAFTEDIQRAYASGMNAHVSKPVVPEALFAAIAGILKKT
ncbi:ATP-binding protein [Phascolarctobacterium sp.]